MPRMTVEMIPGVTPAEIPHCVCVSLCIRHSAAVLFLCHVRLGASE